ncbi:class I adenylate-forming enzyme family protein [Cytobacillus kochii]
MNSSQLVARNARKYPQAQAVIGFEGSLTFQELNDKVNALSNGLLERGIDKGDNVCLFMPNTFEFIITYFAVQRVGAVVIPINAKFTLDEVQYIVDHCEAKAIFAHEIIFSAVESIEKVPLKIKTGEHAQNWESFEQLLALSPGKEVECNLTEDDYSTILYTSGTTGDPKGVLFSYRNILTVAQMIAVEMEVKPDSKMLLMMPLTHSAPLHLFLMSATVVGAAVVITPTFTPDLLLRAVATYRTTHFFGAPVAYLLTAQHPEIKNYDLSTMKWWVYGGAPLAKEQIDLIAERFHTDRLTSVYGLTEAGPSGAIMLPEEHGEKTGSIGMRAPLHTELRIVDEHGQVIPAGEVGEIVLRGEGNMVGYYKNKALTKETFIGDWLKTGDLARRDEEGYIWIVDRKKDVIISGGVNIYPKEIEDVMMKYPTMQEVAIIGLPHREWGETVTAFFSATEEVNSEELNRFLVDHLAKYKIPRSYHQVDMLPRNASGKILKRVLKEGVEQV